MDVEHNLITKMTNICNSFPVELMIELFLCKDTCLLNIFNILINRYVFISEMNIVHF